VSSYLCGDEIGGGMGELPAGCGEKNRIKNTAYRREEGVVGRNPL